MPRLTESLRRAGAWCVLVAVVLVLACQSRPPARVTPVSDAASLAMENAQASLRASERPSRASERDRAREWAEEALRHAPDWVAPRRLLDDLLREDLRGLEALSVHRAALARRGELSNEEYAAEMYLAGRLEGRDGDERFEHAASIDPGLAWAQHGLAFAANTRGERRAAIAFAKHALTRARDPWERSFFTSSLARFLVGAGARDKALELLADRLKQSEVSAGDRVWLGVEAACIGLEDPELARRTTSYARGLELLRGADLSESEVGRLATRMRATGSIGDPESQALVLALAVGQSPARDRVRAELMLEAGSAPLAMGLLERALTEEGRPIPAGPLARSARFAAQQFTPAVERWLSELPPRLRDSTGMPVDARLARVVEAARGLDSVRPSAAGAASSTGSRSESLLDPLSERRADPLFELGDSLVAVGWFREARSVAVALAPIDLDRALHLESRALAGQELIDGLGRLARRMDLDRGLTTPLLSDSVDLARLLRSGEPLSLDDSAPPSNKLTDLHDLLAATGPLFARANVFLGGDTDAKRTSSMLADSVRIQYGPIAEIVHPGPLFSAADEEEGLGKEGAVVPGLAAQMDRLGRFALFGELAGSGGPDGTILSRLLVEQRSGEHLGVAWSGTVAWCEGADLLSRAARRGAHISAAALHEGYWVDIGAVRAEQVQWDELRRDFTGPDAMARVERVLAERGFEVPTDDSASARRERTRTGALLREGARVRLAVLRDRGTEKELGHMELEELLQVTATHEEGHLCDRARFLPLSQHLVAAMGFLLDCGFSPTAVGETLEYRAQLVALCDAPDPRVPLAQVLDAVEDGPSGVTAHASGYARLLDDLLDVLDGRLRKDADGGAGIDRGRTLAHQIHHMKPDLVRSAALELALRKRIVR